MLEYIKRNSINVSISCYCIISKYRMSRLHNNKHAFHLCICVLAGAGLIQTELDWVALSFKLGPDLLSVSLILLRPVG